LEIAILELRRVVGTQEKTKVARPAAGAKKKGKDKSKGKKKEEPTKKPKNLFFFASLPHA